MEENGNSNGILYTLLGTCVVIIMALIYSLGFSNNRKNRGQPDNIVIEKLLKKIKKLEKEKKPKEKRHHHKKEIKEKPKETVTKSPNLGPIEQAKEKMQEKEGHTSDNEFIELSKTRSETKPRSFSFFDVFLLYL